MGALLVLLTVIGCDRASDGSADPERHVEILLGSDEPGEALTLVEALLPRLTHPEDAGLRRRLLRLRATALLMDGRHDAATDSLVQAYADEPGQAARQIHQLGLELCDRRLGLMAAQVAAFGGATWPEHAALFEDLGQRAQRRTWPGPSPHGEIVGQSWGYPMGGFCTHVARYADGHVVTTKVPSGR